MSSERLVWADLGGGRRSIFLQASSSEAPHRYDAPMCNLYHMAPREHVERYFRALAPGYSVAAVGPFGTGLFLRPDGEALVGVVGQCGMVQQRSKTRRPESRAILTNNARSETVATRPTYRGAWATGRRRLIPAARYQEPNWETGKNIWWRLASTEGVPWAIAGLWSEWTDPATGEIVPNYTMLPLTATATRCSADCTSPTPS